MEEKGRPGLLKRGPLHFGSRVFSMKEDLHQNLWLTGDRGSGKTDCLCRRYVDLAHSGIPSEKVLFLAADEARAQTVCQQILLQLGGIWGGRISGIGAFLTEYAREILARRGHSIYPLQFASRCRLYRWLKKCLPEEQRILADHYLSLFDDWRKWRLDSSLLSGIPLSQYPSDEWKRLVALYDKYRSFLEEHRLCDLISLARIFAEENEDSRFLPSYVLVDDAHELNVVTWPVVAKLCHQARFVLATLPEGRLYEEVADSEIGALRDLAAEKVLSALPVPPIIFSESVVRFLADEKSEQCGSWTLLRAASPFEELLQGLLWAKERSAVERVVIFLTAPSAQLEWLLEAAAWLELDLALQGSFWSHWLPSLGQSAQKNGNTQVAIGQNGFLPASSWPACLLGRFREGFDIENEETISPDSAPEEVQFEEALRRGLLKCEFHPNLQCGRGIEVATLERPDLAIGAHVWIVDLCRDTLPGSLPQNPLFARNAASELQNKLASMGHFLNSELTRPMASLFGQSRQRLLDVLNRSKQDVLMSYSMKTSDGQPVAESPFFRSLTQIARGNEKSSKISIELADAIYPVSLLKAHALSSEKPLPSTRYSLTPFPVPVTALMQFLQCPRQFFYEQILKLELPERPTALLIGSLLHDAMAYFLAPGTKTSRPNTDKINRWMEEHFRSNDELTNLPDGIRFSLKRFVRSVLLRFFEYDVWQGGVESVEQSFELAVPGGFRLKGRVDRVDLTTDGLEVIDYKSQTSFGSSKLRGEFLAAEDWIQLPVYVKAIETFHKRSVSRVSVIFFGIKAKDEPKRSTVEIHESESPETEKKRVRHLIRKDELDQVWMRIAPMVEEIFRENQSFGRGENPPCERFLHGCPFVLICPVARASNEESAENSA